MRKLVNFASRLKRISGGLKAKLSGSKARKLKEKLLKVKGKIGFARRIE